MCCAESTSENSPESTIKQSTRSHGTDSSSNGSRPDCQRHSLSPASRLIMEAEYCSSVKMTISAFRYSWQDPQVKSPKVIGRPWMLCHIAPSNHSNEGSFAGSYSTQSERSLMNMCHVSRWAVPAATQSGRRNINHLRDARFAAQQCAAAFTSLITNAPKVDRRGFLQQFVPTHFRGRPYFRFVDRISCCKVRQQIRRMRDRQKTE